MTTIPYSRTPSDKIEVGKISIGYPKKISVQTLCSTKTENIKETVKQIQDLELLGCDLVRVVIDSKKSISAISEIQRQIQIPLVADVLFDLDLIVKTIRRGIDKIRINPICIKDHDLKIIVEEAKIFKTAIRVGINAGALSSSIINTYGNSTQALIEAVNQSLTRFNKLNFQNLIISVKSSNIIDMINANLEVSKMTKHPVHLGVTQSGTRQEGLIKSSLGIGYLLLHGIGDTIRISMGDKPEAEVLAGVQLLRNLGLRKGPKLIAGYNPRSEMNVYKITKLLEKKLAKIQTNMTIAVIGSLVEKQELQNADLGVGGDGRYAVIYKNGQKIDRVPHEKVVNRIVTEVEKFGI